MKNTYYRWIFWDLWPTNTSASRRVNCTFLQECIEHDEFGLVTWPTPQFAATTTGKIDTDFQSTTVTRPIDRLSLRHNHTGTAVSGTLVSYRIEI